MNERLRDIPQLHPSGANLTEWARAVQEALQIFRGYRGDPLDKAITERRGIAIGLLNSLGQPTGAGVGGGIVPGGGTVPDLTPPPTPTGLTVAAGITQLIVQCAPQTYTAGHGHDRTNVYGAKWPTGNPTAPTFAVAVRLFQFLGTVDSYVTDPSTRWCIWIKWQSVDGVESVSPAGGVNGVQATTGQDVSLLLTALTGTITESHLFAALNTRINLIDGANTLSGSVAQRILTETNARAAALAALSAVKNRTFYSATAPVSDVSYTLIANDTWIDTADNNKLYRYSGTAWVLSADARISGNAADITTETNARIAADLAEVSARESLYAGFGGAASTEYKVFNQAAPPAPSVSVIGDVWTWKTGAGVETFRRWDGAAWVDSIANKRAAIYLGEYANAAALPTTGNVIGDLVRRSDSTSVFVWNGTAWVAKTTTPLPSFAFVEQERVARATAVSAQASRVDLLVASVDTPSTGLLARATVLEATTTHVTSGNTALANRSVTLESSVNSPTTGNNPTYARLLTEESTRASADGGITAQQMTKLDVNGHVSGYGIMSSLIAGGTPTSLFIVNVDKFAVATPSSSVPTWAASTVTAESAVRGITAVLDKLLVCKVAGTTGTVAPSIAGAVGTLVLDGGVTWQIASRVPFSVLTTPTTINGVSIPAGVYIDAAYVLNATINSQQIRSLTADKITTGTLNSALIFAGALSAATGTFSGSLSAATGTFAGSLSAATGSFVGTMLVGTTPAVSGTTMTGSGAVFNADGSGAFGNSTSNITRAVGGGITLNGPVVQTANIVVGAVTAQANSVTVNSSMAWSNATTFWTPDASTGPGMLGVSHTYSGGILQIRVDISFGLTGNSTSIAAIELMAELLIKDSAGASVFTSLRNTAQLTPSSVAFGGRSASGGMALNYQYPTGGLTIGNSYYFGLYVTGVRAFDATGVAILSGGGTLSRNGFVGTVENKV